MKFILKKQNNSIEEHFHDEWAESTSLEKIDVVAQFEGPTSPEYKKAVHFLGNIKGKKILNVGCGLGEEAVYLGLKGAKVTVIDISKKMLKATEKLAKKYNVSKNIECFHMSTEDLVFKSNSFDTVIGCNVLHHIDISRGIKEVFRVLKKNGSAVFVEPLNYNFLINIYRLMANKVRTDHEHPLREKDLKVIKKVFPSMKHSEFHLTTLFIFVWFFIGKRVHPNKERYWKKIIIEGQKYKNIFNILYSIDKFIIMLFPFLWRYYWETVIEIKK